MNYVRENSNEQIFDSMSKFDIVTFLVKNEIWMETILLINILK